MKLKSAVVHQDPPWRHDWHTVATWNRAKERWEARMRPGLVNALPATVNLPREEFPRDTLRRYKALGIDPPESADVPLTDVPRIPLTSFRALGSDGSATGSEGAVLSFEGVPEFFRLLGVGPPPEIDLNDPASLNRDVSLNTCLLRAVDLVLQVDRPATATRWSVDSSGLGNTVAQFGLSTITKPDARKAAYVRATARWTPPAEIANLLAGEVSDSPTDEYHICTVFLLSPKGAPLDSAPDGTWTAFTQQHGAFFWQMCHAINRPRRLAEQNLRLDTGLAGGAGDAVNAFILSQINDANSRAVQFLAGGRLLSNLWTA